MASLDTKERYKRLVNKLYIYILSWNEKHLRYFDLSAFKINWPELPVRATSNEKSHLHLASEESILGTVTV